MTTPSMLYAHAFDDLFDDLNDGAGLGGKGANLIRLRSAHFPVPDGFCVGVAAYYAFIAANALASRLDRLADTPDLQQPRVAREAAAELAPSLAAACLPHAVDAEVRAAYQQLRQRTRPDLVVAVRSSSLSEDSAGASSAGQYESYLQVCDAAAVVESVLDCFRSLWSYRAIQYRAMKRLDGRREAMAVVVMEMVPADVSGVTFTVNPVTGNRGELVTNATWGLGEALVSGRVTPDCFVVDKGDLHSISQQIASKELEIVPCRNGAGTVSRPVPAARAREAALDEPLLRQICAVCRAIERHYGVPQDIEWAIHGGRLYILQARPVTTI